MKPASGPKAIPVIIMTAVMGLKFGIITATREATASAHMTASVTNSRAWGFLVSKARKNGIMISITIRVLVR